MAFIHTRVCGDVVGDRGSVYVRECAFGALVWGFNDLPHRRPGRTSLGVSLTHTSNSIQPFPRVGGVILAPWEAGLRTFGALMPGTCVSFYGVFR